MPGLGKRSAKAVDERDGKLDGKKRCVRQESVQSQQDDEIDADRNAGSVAGYETESGGVSPQFAEPTKVRDGV